MPSNFRTYEAQSRLLAAVIASSPSLKLNFKEIALHYGSDATAWSIQHRFRPIRKQAAAVRQAVAEGKDAKDLAGLFHLNDKDIAKYYGESTPQGIEFQFRAIRKDAKALRDAVDKGESPLTARKHVAAASTSAGSGAGPSSSAATPASRKRKTSAADQGDGASGASGGSSSARALTKKTAAAVKRGTKAGPIVLSNEDDNLASEVDYEELDLTPVTTPTKKMMPASRSAAAVVTTAAPPPKFGAVTAAPGASTASTALLPITPGSSFIPDGTPALSIGATPPENETPDTDMFHGTSHTQQAQQHRQQIAHANPMFYTRNNSGIDDDDEEDVFIVDTPSKMPKVEPVTSEPTVQNLASMSGDFAGWQNLNHLQSHNQNAHDTQAQTFSFDTSGSWGQAAMFSPNDPLASFSDPMTQSFYDNDGSI